ARCGRDTGVQPARINLRHWTARDVCRIFQLFENETVANLFLELIQRGFPFGGDGARFDVDGRSVPAQRLIENWLQRKTPLLPRFWDSTAFKRNGRCPPNILQLSTRDLLRVKIEHVREILERPSHVAPTI